MKYEKLVRTTSASLAKHTGRSWDEWIALLTKAGALNWPRREIVLYARKTYRLTPWWEQIVASGFEIAVGRRIEGQNEKGLYAAAGSKTFHVGAKKMWKWLVAHPEVWLRSVDPVAIKTGTQFESSEGAFGEIRTIAAGRSVRFRWQQDDWEKHTTCVVSVFPRQGEKCIVTFGEDGIASARAKEERKKYWKSVLDEIARLAIKK